MNEAVATSLQDALKVVNKTEAITPVAGTEIDRLLATGERLLKSQQERMLTEESDYQRRRVAMADQFRVHMERLRQDAEDQLRTLDSEHEAKMARMRNLIAKLKALREA